MIVAVELNINKAYRHQHELGVFLVQRLEGYPGSRSNLGLALGNGRTYLASLFVDKMNVVARSRQLNAMCTEPFENQLVQLSLG